MKKLLLLFTAILTALLLASPVYAADIRLSSRCTLADAIIAANSDRAEGGCPAGHGTDTITLTRDITLDGGLPKITSDITIEGNGYTISGDNRWRIFYNDGGALTINDLTMTKGRAEGDRITNADGRLKNATANPIGGAIVNWEGTLSIVNSYFSNNSAENGGGAIYNEGELSISDSAFSHNLAEETGGAIFNWEELSITSSAFSNNSAFSGGAINNWGEFGVSIVNSTFSHNWAFGGGAIAHDGYGELSISTSAFSGNKADSFGGAINNWGEFVGVSISDSTFSDNSADSWGGAIYNEGKLSISDSAFTTNSAGTGGAIRNGGWLSIVNSAFSGNSAEETGGAIFNWEELSIISSPFSGNSADKGGAIANDGNGYLSISGSTFQNNSADSFGGAINNRVEGGGVSIVNSAFSRNSAERGGAIDNTDYGYLSIGSSTFSGNLADYAGAIFNLSGTLSMGNSIIAGRGGNACSSNAELRHNIRNFIQDGSCSPTFKGDPMLGRLVMPRDGSPAYFPLLAGSPVIDAADDEYCPATDQIGTVRPQGAGCDIGAIEYAAP